jgi:hypothetical protein
VSIDLVDEFARAVPAEAPIVIARWRPTARSSAGRRSPAAASRTITSSRPSNASPTWTAGEAVDIEQAVDTAVVLGSKARGKEISVTASRAESPKGAASWRAEPDLVEPARQRSRCGASPGHVTLEPVPGCTRSIVTTGRHPAEIRSKIFDPFFTTAGRAGGPRLNAPKLARHNNGDIEPIRGLAARNFASSSRSTWRRPAVASGGVACAGGSAMKKVGPTGVQRACSSPLTGLRPRPVVLSSAHIQAWLRLCPALP